MHITRSIAKPPRPQLTWEEQWNKIDQGLIACWERGRQKSIEDPTLAAKAIDGQLVILPWKGGVEKAIKKQEKYGSLKYLAMWQGLRGEALNIETDKEMVLTCAKTKMKVVFTSDHKRLADA